ncbi:MAG: MerR family transcriptional regulator [Flavobacteriales bacterium]|nr:MerR family transcriptional regulator [Flavobacteriales bacterium]|tara:strand:+ start:12957 stop:13283 length:327 start_codon:yes stop_codon:yes gene_type:complete
MKDDNKLYYSIGEIANILKVNNSLIRFWEKEFEIIKPKKNSRGNRIFTKKDLENITLIHHLLKEKKYTIDGARKKIRENKDGAQKNFQIIDKLKNIRQKLSEIRNELK